MPMLTVLVVGHAAAADAYDVAPEGKCESEHGEGNVVRDYGEPGRRSLHASACYRPREWRGTLIQFPEVAIMRDRCPS